MIGKISTQMQRVQQSEAHNDGEPCAIPPAAGLTFRAAIPRQWRFGLGGRGVIPAKIEHKSHQYKEKMARQEHSEYSFYGLMPWL